MLLLALESAADTSSVAVWDSARPEAGLAFRGLEAARGQADRLVELCEEALATAGLDYDALELIAVDHGPGSFTGLRSAVAAARGFALAAGLPVLAVGSLEALAGSVVPRPGEAVLAALDARRGQVYAQSFDADLAPLQDPWLATPEQVAAGLAGRPARLVGSGAGAIRAALPAASPLVIEAVTLDARAVARRAVARLAAGARPSSGFALHPLYLRPPDVRPPAPLLAAHAGAPGA